MRTMVVPCLILMLAAASASAAEIKDVHWRLGPNLPEHRKGGCAAALNGKAPGRCPFHSRPRIATRTVPEEAQARPKTQEERELYTTS